MNRRTFLRSLFASTAAIVVAPADVFDALPPPPGDPRRTYVDMGRMPVLDRVLGTAPNGCGRAVLSVDGMPGWECFRPGKSNAIIASDEVPHGLYVRRRGAWRRVNVFASGYV